MFQVLVACSGCEEEAEVVVGELDDVNREACPCGYSYVVLTVSEFEPVFAEHAEVIPLRRRPRKLSNAA
jgi:hypothetical protein